MEDSKKISEEQCKKIIEKYINSTDVDIQSHSLNLHTAQFDGLLGEQYILKIQYKVEGKVKDSQFFVKILNGANTLMFKISKEILAYEKEAFYYQTFLPLFKSKGFSFDDVAECYFCEPYVVVLQDLSLLSYKGTTKGEPLDLEHCKKCLETLAKFHATTILYEEARSKELEKPYRITDEYSEILIDKIYTDESTLAAKYITSSVKGIFQLIETAFDDIDGKSEFKNILEGILDEIMSSDKQSVGFRSTILHADVWSNNFLYKYNEKNEIIDCKLIDFQIIRYGPPALDVLQFLLTNTRKSFRDLHQKELLSYYYKYFSGLLEKQGHRPEEILPEIEFKETCDTFIIPSKIHAVADRAVTLLPEEVFAKAAQTEETFSKFLFEGRGDYMVKSFKEYEYFREIISEDIYELMELVSATHL